ncbi:hypothetical protein BJ741DRAFT_351984 [Chytriomyces cf. hyalinus JEL632]|nr:hypothetical protein BJ741DRAFT_351984 [Chytriomyces cf. hyalinus JEL632]
MPSIPATTLLLLLAVASVHAFFLPNRCGSVWSEAASHCYKPCFTRFDCVGFNDGMNNYDCFHWLDSRPCVFGIQPPPVKKAAAPAPAPQPVLHEVSVAKAPQPRAPAPAPQPEPMAVLVPAPVVPVPVVPVPALAPVLAPAPAAPAPAPVPVHVPAAAPAPAPVPAPAPAPVPESAPAPVQNAPPPAVVSNQEISATQSGSTVDAKMSSPIESIVSDVSGSKSGSLQKDSVGHSAESTSSSSSKPELSIATSAVASAPVAQISSELKALNVTRAPHQILSPTTVSEGDSPDNETQGLPGSDQGEQLSTAAIIAICVAVAVVFLLGFYCIHLRLRSKPTPPAYETKFYASESGLPGPLSLSGSIHNDFGAPLSAGSIDNKSIGVLSRIATSATRVSIFSVSAYRDFNGDSEGRSVASSGRSGRS